MEEMLRRRLGVKECAWVGEKKKGKTAKDKVQKMTRREKDRKKDGRRTGKDTR